MNSKINSMNLTVNEIEELFKLADVSDRLSLRGKILLNVFFESSTRTSLSFESAMKRLGGEVITFNKDISSINKGESFLDTIKTLSLYGDLMVLRHSEKGIVDYAQKYVNIPIINGGDGSGHHPTQALIDLYTIYKKFGCEFSKKSILFLGDAKNSRTIHSLIELINLYPNMKIYVHTHHKLNLTDSEIEKIRQIHNQEIVFIEDLTLLFLSDIDIVYCTRIQKERMSIPKYLFKSKPYHKIIVDSSFVSQLNEDTIIMHPLPRNNEITYDVDTDHRCYYFKQMEYGVKLRKALLYSIFN